MSHRRPNWDDGNALFALLSLSDSSSTFFCLVWQSKSVLRLGGSVLPKSHLCPRRSEASLRTIVARKTKDLFGNFVCTKKTTQILPSIFSKGTPNACAETTTEKLRKTARGNYSFVERRSILTRKKNGLCMGQTVYPRNIDPKNSFSTCVWKGGRGSQSSSPCAEQNGTTENRRLVGTKNNFRFFLVSNCWAIHIGGTLKQELSIRLQNQCFVFFWTTRNLCAINVAGFTLGFLSLIRVLLRLERLDRK